jgi:LysM repeat protein
MKQAAPAKVTASVAKPAQVQKDISTGNAVVHVVRKGENLWSISQLYDDVTYYDLMKLNDLTKKIKDFPGR